MELSWSIPRDRKRGVRGKIRARSATSNESRKTAFVSTTGKVQRQGVEQDKEGTSQNFGWHMIKSWILYAGLPSGLATWKLTGSITLGGIAVFFLPASALLQGAIHIVRYRIFFGGTPLPQVPCSGVVKATTRHHDQGPAPVQDWPTTWEDVDGNDNDARVPQIATCTSSGKCGDSDNEIGSTTDSNRAGEDKVPLRLLVIGDSLAIGVGQSKHSTPQLPEAIAKTLSRALGARPVIWTCYGAPGASAAWIAKELERSSCKTSSACSACGVIEVSIKPESETETDDSSSSSEESSSQSEDGERLEKTSVDDRFRQLAWHKRLFKQPLIRKNPNQQDQRLVGGPYDIAVVFSGGNDVKSTFFPFLLTGEDARLYHQARSRGGQYAIELRRVLEMLNRRMRLRLQTLRESVEAAKENLREYIVRDGLYHQQQHHNQNQVQGGEQQHRPESTVQWAMWSGSVTENGCSKPQAVPSHTHEEQNSLLLSFDKTEGQEYKGEDTSQQLFPMVVLPGMPAPALPVFEWGPLRWFSLNIVRRMDSQKRKLARSHKGEVLFVEAPSEEDISDYHDHVGRYWRQRCTESTLLNVRDVKRRRARRIEADMKQYEESSRNARFSRRSPSKPHHATMFSLDRIHPTDEGYDFWGRHIGSAIVREWRENGKDVVDPLDS